MRESIADILLSSGKAHEALVEYQHSLQIDPNRFNGLLGAGRAAEQSGQNSLAVDYYRTLLANCDGASGAALKELEHARSIAR
jgi:tetratricopeptide (TPR) repeat protein